MAADVWFFFRFLAFDNNFPGDALVFADPWSDVCTRYYLRSLPAGVRIALTAPHMSQILTMTHPAVWFVFTQLFLVGTTEYVVAAESWAVAAEAAFYWAAVTGLTVRRAIAVALLANLASFVAGRLVTELWPELFW